MELRYVLVTAARNEEAYIPKTIESVAAQKIKPLQWVIVSDGSTDNTDAIVKEYSMNLPWITFVRQPESHQRDFTRKAFAIRLAIQYIRDDNYELIGNLDGDISFDDDLFSFLGEKFKERESLGVGGPIMVEDGYDYSWDRRFDTRDVFGACQIFRKRCFEEIGGYRPLKIGGIDWFAVKLARMKGWETRTFIEKKFIHHKPMGYGGRGIVYARFDYGRKDYVFGNLFIWEILRSLYQGTKKPYVIGGVLILIGYIWAWLKRIERPMDDAFLSFHRKEQKEKLREVIREVFGLWHGAATNVNKIKTNNHL